MLTENDVRVASERNGKLAPTVTVPARLMSDTPGRFRFRVASDYRFPATVQPIATALRSHLPNASVRVNLDNGSVTVYYDRDRISGDRLYGILQDLNIRFVVSDKSDAATELTEVIASANRQIDRVTEGAVDLRFLVPLGFGTLAVRQLIVEGVQLNVIPWYALAWYAFDSFLKLHYTLGKSEN
ncbi:HMA2 domain-containing protein [Baaleninema simplex]|uniref:HMA2 domain-containing protein n=1 Tax=Baaleninema simplex TaxID=2862350 RepID=UPI000345B071|nr:hypothetical protein [Baaleninema simplex]